MPPPDPQLKLRTEVAKLKFELLDLAGTCGEEVASLTQALVEARRLSNQAASQLKAASGAWSTSDRAAAVAGGQQRHGKAHVANDVLRVERQQLGRQLAELRGLRSGASEAEKRSVCRVLRAEVAAARDRATDLQLKRRAIKPTRPSMAENQAARRITKATRRFSNASAASRRANTAAGPPPAAAAAMQSAARRTKQPRRRPSQEEAAAQITKATRRFSQQQKSARKGTKQAAAAAPTKKRHRRRSTYVKRALLPLV